MGLKITVLIENTTESELKCEHGLSLYIEYKDKKLLLDAGSSELFAENARALGIDLSEVDLAFLSHGHYDHSGGFLKFTELNRTAPVYAMEGVTGEYYSTSGGTLHGIGIPGEVMNALKTRFAFVTEVTKVAEGITLVPHSTEGLGQIGERAGLYYKKGGEMMPDDFAHEMSLVLECENGLVILNSCSHGGVQNIVEEVKAVFPDKRVYAYVGGLHMKGQKDGVEICAFTEEEIQELTDYIQQIGMEILYTGHCTGAPAMLLLKEKLGAGVLAMTSGEVYNIL